MLASLIDIVLFFLIVAVFIILLFVSLFVAFLFLIPVMIITLLCSGHIIGAIVLFVLFLLMIECHRH